MRPSANILFWPGAFAVLLLFVYVFSSILVPFVAGLALAYLLDPLADRLQRLGLSRLFATILIVVVFLVAAALALILVVPVLVDQLAGFSANLPGYVDRLQEFASAQLRERLPGVFGGSGTELEGSLSTVLGESGAWLLSLLRSLWNGGQALASVLALFVVTPVVAFYMLLDWDRMVARIDGWLPRDHAPTLRGLFAEMDLGVANFVRGQTSVSTVLGLFYAVSLTAVGLDYGLLIGLGAGLVSFVPYVGALMGGVLAIGVALVQGWPDWTWILLVAAVFAVGQFLEGNLLQPWLLGSRVGLHPVWLMFALFAFASLFGFLGMLIAVPAATAVAVLCRFALQRYLASDVYRGRSAALIGLPPGERRP